MELSAQIKNQMIENYIQQIDFSGDYSMSKIKNDLKTLLQEMPGVEIKYKKNKFGHAKFDRNIFHSIRLTRALVYQRS